MATTASRPQDVPTISKPTPNPTHPVAGRSVTDGAPTFEWTSVPDADRYRLQLAASDDFETIYYDEAVEGPTSLAPTDVLPDGATTVVWRVRVEDDTETSWSTPAHFDVSTTGAGADDAQFLVDAPPVPIHPVEGDAVDAHLATFTWELVPKASGYRIQIGTTDAFDEPIVDLSFDRVTSVTLSDALEGEKSTLYWRVCALFPDDTSGPWSEAARFGTDSETVEVKSDDDAPTSSSSPAAPPKNSPVAAGPAQRAHTSTAMAMTFVFVLVVSFIATILTIALL
jgi:hypothetical protein